MYQNGFLNLLQAQMAGQQQQQAVNITHEQQQLLAAMAAATAKNAGVNNFLNQASLYNQLYPVKEMNLSNQQIPSLSVSNSKAVKTENPATHEEQKFDDVSEGDRAKARLARNRTTARLRRERKKSQAEGLTKQVAELTFKLETLEAHLETLGAKAKKNILKALESFGPAPVACIFCDLDFPKEDLRTRHIESAHAAEYKARQSSRQAQEPDKKSEEDGSVSKMSYDSRRKRRLERNAASARLCRQRKKLYIENLRLQLPTLRHRVDSLRKLIPNADAVLEKKLAQAFKVEVTSSGNVSKTGNSKKAELVNTSTTKNDGNRGGSTMVPTSPIQSGSVSVGPSGDIKVNIPRLSGWDSSNRRQNNSGYESGGSTGSNNSNKSKCRKETKESDQGQTKRRRGSTSVDISSGSPSPISTMTSFGISPTPFSLSSSPLITSEGKPALPFVLGQSAPSAALLQQAPQDQDVFNAAVALSTLVPFATPLQQQN